MKQILRKVRNYGIKTSAIYGAHELKRLYNRLAYRSYSLDREDLIIERLVNRQGPGFYVDIGAYDPKRLSNTQHFYLKGWRGINIEPNPLAKARFLKVRPRDTNLSLAVGGNEQEVATFYSMFPATVSTFSEDFRDLNLARGCELVDTIKLPIMPLENILSEHLPDQTELDFMSIDTEGHEMDVLESNNWSRFRPKVICIESCTQFYSKTHDGPNKVYRHYKFLHE